jgi:hypothetical protein
LKQVGFAYSLTLAGKRYKPLFIRELKRKNHFLRKRYRLLISIDSAETQ